MFLPYAAPKCNRCVAFVYAWRYVAFMNALFNCVVLFYLYLNLRITIANCCLLFPPPPPPPPTQRFFFSCGGAFFSQTNKPTTPRHHVQVILGAGQLFQAQQDLLHRTAPLLLSYYLIKWGSQCLATDVPVDTL